MAVHPAALTLFWFTRNCQVIATLVPAAAGRATPSPRLLSRLRIAAVGAPAPSDLEAIAAQLLRGVLSTDSAPSGGGSGAQAAGRARAAAAAQAPAVAAAIVSLYARAAALAEGGGTSGSGGCSGGAALCRVTPRDLMAAIRGLARCVGDAVSDHLTSIVALH